MLALTVRQPFATPLVRRVKPGENRTWDPPSGQVRLGTWLAVHAASAYYAFEDPDGERYVANLFDVPLAGLRALPRSAIVGLLRFSGVVDGSEALAKGDMWAVPGSRYWTFDRGVELRAPVQCGGRLGLWAVPDDAWETVRTDPAVVEARSALAAEKAPT